MFMELLRFSRDSVRSEQARTKKFKLGLNLSIREILRGMHFPTSQKLYNRALIIPRMQQKMRKVVGESSEQSKKERFEKKKNFDC